MASFYGGRQGKSFSIKKIFSDKASLIEDLNKNQDSEVYPGDLVFISYGNSPNTDEKNYNNTLWQKFYSLNNKGYELKYVEDITSETNENLHYYLLANITGSSPKISIGEVNTISLEEEASAEIDNSDIHNPILNFNIPRGINLFSGIEVEDGNLNFNVENSLWGDYYLNSETKKLYRLNNQNTWEFQTTLEGKQGPIGPQGIQGEVGPAGPSLKIVANYSITSDDMEDSIENIGEYIYTNYGKYPESDEIIAISYKDLQNDMDTSYWFFYTQNAWGRAILTGGVADLIQNEYSSLNEINKSYSINYINKLIQNSPTQKDLQTYTATFIDNLNEYLNSHISNRSNPHEVTASQIGAELAGSAQTALTEAKTYTDQKISEIPTPDVGEQIQEHNTSVNPHENMGWINSKEEEISSGAQSVALYNGEQQILPKTKSELIQASNGKNLDQFLNETFLQKSGGVITGELNVQGDLKQNGNSIPELINNKINKVIPSKANNLALLNSEGQLIDSNKNIEEIGTNAKVYKATLNSSSWTSEGGSDRFTQNITVDGITSETKIILVDCDLSTNDVSAKNLIFEAWAGPSAYEVKQGNGTLTFYTMTIPSVNIPILIGVL